MLAYLTSTIKDFKNINGYSFDFEPNVLKELNFSIFDEVNNAEKLIMFHNNKSHKLPKKVTLKWIVDKFGVQSNFNNLSSTFATVLKHGSCYPTSYGLGYFCLFKNDENFKKDTTEIKKQLDILGIIYKTEFSDARYVLRFVISTQKENLLRITEMG